MKRIRYILALLFVALALPSAQTAFAGRPVRISTPGDGATVSGTVQVTGSGDGSAVEVAIDGGAWEPTSGDWSYTWDTTGVNDGSHTVTAQYADGSGSDTINVTVANGGGGSARQPTVGEVLINEFVAAPTSPDPEWVELYNSTSEDLDIGEMYLDDIAGGGTAPLLIPAGTTISAGDFYVLDDVGMLNNTGDDVRLLGTDGTTVHDSTTYGSASSDVSWCRDPDGGAWRTIECTPTKGTTNDPPLPPGTWTPGTLEIHVLNVGQGESQLIIGPNGRSMLIGVYEPSWNTNQGAAYVASEVRRITGGEHVNYILATHWHLDHIGYAGYGGIWSLLEEQGITTDAIIDRNGAEWVDSNSDGICDPDTEINWINAGTVSGTARNWVCWVDDPTTLGGQLRQVAQLDSTTQIDLGLSTGVTTTIVQVDADGVMMVDGVTPVQGDHTADALPPSENDYSITIWVNWGKFDFVAGGDTDGEYATSSFGYTYNDVETNVAARINQEVEAIWVNHHGSSHSSNPTYVGTLSPAAALFSCGATNTYGHPGQNVLDNFNAEGSQMYFTQFCDPTRDYYDAIDVGGNIELQVTNNGDAYTVNGDAYTASDPGGSSGGPRDPLVGEVVINEFLANNGGRYKDEFVELFNTTGDELNIGGMWLDDIAGGGGSPIQIPAGTILAPGGYYVHEMSTYFNNTGDDVRLLWTDQSTLFDSYTYSSSVRNEFTCRIPDGGTWTTGCSPTPGDPN